MANKTASLRFNLSYVAPGGGTVSYASPVQSVPYQAQVEGTIDIPDTTPASTSYALSFGSIGTVATLLLVVNKSGQPLTIKVNSTALDYTLGVDEFAILELGSAVGAHPITAASVVTTGIQAGQGSVDYFVFGDPV